MRSVINISLPTNLANVVDDIVDSGNYASKSEFFRTLLRSFMEEKMLYELRKSQKELKSGKGRLLKSLKDLR